MFFESGFLKFILGFCMLGFTDDWSDILPIDHTKFKAVPGAVRDVRLAVSERLAAFLSGFTAGETAVGIKSGVFLVQGSDPAAVADQIKLYSVDLGGKTGLKIIDEDGNTITLIELGKLILDDGRLRNDIHLRSIDTAGSGTIDLIKSRNDKATLPDTAQMASNAAPTADEMISNKKYVDDQITGTERIVQLLSSENGSVVTGSTAIPYDDTLPQVTEGTQHMSFAVTPDTTGNYLEITVVWNGANANASNPVTVALFQDGGANALGAAAVSGAAENPLNVSFKTRVSAVGGAVTVFTVRAGSHSVANTTSNGATSGRKFGGKYMSSIKVIEYKP